MPTEGGPSWLTFIGHVKDSLWSLDLFRCESVALRTYWVLVVMDLYTRRIIGFGIQAGVVDGTALCRMFKQAIRTDSAITARKPPGRTSLKIVVITWTSRITRSRMRNPTNP